MPRFAANLGYLFQEHAFLDRFAAARAAGFAGVEFARPWAHPPRQIAARLEEHGLACVLFNLPMEPPGAPPMFGMACRPEHVADFRAGVDRALDYAAVLGNKLVNCIAGTVTADDDPARCQATLAENLAYAAARVSAAGLTLLVEPINARDVPGFFLPTADDAARAIAVAGAGGVFLQCDLYHAAMMGEDPSATLARHHAIVRHVQFADVPGRGEPGSGTLDFAHHFDTLARLGYDGWVSAEYKPTRPTRDTLGWLARFA